jgi:hypothetical protein
LAKGLVLCLKIPEKKYFTESEIFLRILSSKELLHNTGQDKMDINKIYVKVDHKDYAGLYWISEADSKLFINVSFAGVKNISGPIDKENLSNSSAVAKKMLHELITNMQ